MSDSAEYPPEGIMRQLTNQELHVLTQVLNEVLNGPDAIEASEFATRLGVTRAEATALLERVSRMSADAE